MLNYENVSSGSLYAKFYSKDVQKIIDMNRLKTIKDLLDYMQIHDEKDFLPIKERLKKTMEQINSNSDKYPKIYKVKEYGDETLKYVDRMNYGRELLLSSPTTIYSLKYDGLSYKPINEIIDGLSLATPTGENFLIQSTRKIGYNSVPIIIDALNMYRDQIVRQSKLTDSRKDNIFRLDKYEKMYIVCSKYSEIINYLINNSQELVWGKLTRPQKKLYLSSMFNTTKPDVQIKDAMIKSISNYTTLPELEELKNDDYKILKRFIKR